MSLPGQIPRRLRVAAVSHPDLGDAQGAWNRGDALAVIESLRGTLVSVVAVVAFEPTSWGLEAASEWRGFRRPYESDRDYADRSHAGAGRFISECEVDVDDLLFALTFPEWKDAA